jgi:hypothetical protein
MVLAFLIQEFLKSPPCQSPGGKEEQRFPPSFSMARETFTLDFVPQTHSDEMLCAIIAQRNHPIG